MRIYNLLLSFFDSIKRMRLNFLCMFVHFLDCFFLNVYVNKKKGRLYE